MNERNEELEIEKKITWYTVAVLFYTSRLELTFGLILLMSAAMPILLYHFNMVNLYRMMASDAVAAYTTAIYVSAMLTFKLVNDARRDRWQDKMNVYRNNRKAMDSPENKITARQLEQVDQQLFSGLAYGVRTRMIRYLAIWVSYMFVSLSYNSVRSAVGC